MARDRDVGAFDERAASYESGWRGRLHQRIAGEVAVLVAQVSPSVDRVLDVGCGTGYLLRDLAGRLSAVQALEGIDPAPRMVETARSMGNDPRLGFRVGVAEELPYDDGSFGLVVSTTSFDHWRDQRRGLRECARVLESQGQLLLADVFSSWLAMTLFGSRRRKARTPKRVTLLLAEAGLGSALWQPLGTPLISAVVATKP